MHLRRALLCNYEVILDTAAHSSVSASTIHFYIHSNPHYLPLCRRRRKKLEKLVNIYN